MRVTKEHIAATYKCIQDEITAGLEALDGRSTFVEEMWERVGGCVVRTCIILDGNILEIGVVNISAVHGNLVAAIKKSFQVEEEDFFATGVSIVIQPNNPWVSII